MRGQQELFAPDAEYTWQRPFCDFNVWTARKRIEKLRYMHRNPVAWGLMQEPEQWPWSSYRGYAFGEEGAVGQSLGRHGSTSRRWQHESSALPKTAKVGQPPSCSRDALSLRGDFQMRKLRLLALPIVVLTIATAARPQSYSVLHNFDNTVGGPSYPGIVAQGRDGNLYSTTPGGGADDYGTVFQITPDGTLTVLHSFSSGTHGACGSFYCTVSGLTLGTDGSFYGTTTAGGSLGYGIVFKITPNGSFTVLHNFAGGSDGATPVAPPIEGTDGNFYGSTSAENVNGYPGTLYRITRSGRLTTLYQFSRYDTAGSLPFGPLVQGIDGNFYGTTNLGGTHGGGTIFKVNPKGKLTVLHNIWCYQGCGVFGPLVQGSDTDLYGAFNSIGNGTLHPGSIFRISPTGKFTVLHYLNGAADGGQPLAGLVEATDGNFYGTTTQGGSAGYGTIYQITPQGSFSVLYDFDVASGNYAEVTLLQRTNGILYGDTQSGGIGTGCPIGCGVFYSLNISSGPFVSLVSASAKVGKTVEILGQGLTGTSAVAFNGTSASFQVVSDTYLTATVPSGATTGFVTVTTPGGILTSNKEFRVRTQTR
jgi:uncharacterized repeat protein (TIGR03803 family)